MFRRTGLETFDEILLEANNIGDDSLIFPRPCMYLPQKILDVRFTVRLPAFEIY